MYESFKSKLQNHGGTQGVYLEKRLEFLFLRSIGSENGRLCRGPTWSII